MRFLIRRLRPIAVIAEIALVSTVLCRALSAADEKARVDFGRDIRPILSDICFKCHGPDEKARDSELRLDTKEGAFADLGGHRAIVPGDAPASELIVRITSDDPDMHMPPPDSGRTLSASQIELLKRWIEQEAPWQEHWSFIPPQPAALPSLNKYSAWCCNPIDRFIAARLESENLAPAPAAAKETLIRRVTLDLTGLPPTLAEVDAFLADESSDAYERLVDRLLASPRYGEHMAAAWLDAARYGDTNGYQQDRTRTMWPWRDWVIDALNANMPFDQFTIEQIAGDLLPSATPQQHLATGFNRNHPLNGEGGRIAEESRVEYVVDRVETTATVWLGLTAGCARCHDHKYDPLSQQEFYNLYAFFNSIDESGGVDAGGNAKPVMKVPTREGEQEVMVMAERRQPRETFVLKAGQYDQPDKTRPAKPNAPAVLPPLGESVQHDRLALARWLVDPANPLTARVTVNRIWLHHFGIGLVKTTEDFGVQGEPPSHPELLDWLALELIRSGWDVKHLHRLIVTSATYRQSSQVERSLPSPTQGRSATSSYEDDPENRLFARGPRFRLSSLAIRDQALALAGLLVEKIGGPPVKPYQPPGVWEDFSLGKIKYQRDTGEKLYRRSVYTFWRRSVAPTTLFDTASRLVCDVRTHRTNTPLHALTTLNDPAYVEAARLFAERMMTAGGDTPEERLAWAFRLATSRRPSESETGVLRRALDRAKARYEADPAAAQELLSVGEMPRDEKLPLAELAAYTSVANMLFNLDEVLTRE